MTDEKSDVDDLARIFIRARTVSSGWGTYSLRKLLDSGNAGQIGAWFIGLVLGHVGTCEAAIIDEAVAQRMVAFIEAHVRPLHRLRAGDDVP